MNADEEKYIRKVQTSVTNFLVCGDYYLFLHRNLTKRTDPNCLNGIGGRLESGEDYLTAAIRETEEETGYIVNEKNIKLSGVVKLQGGYPEDWVMSFFKIEVKDQNIPLGNETEDGKLVWIHKDEVLDSDYELVDDLNYCFKDIVNDQLFFLTAELNDDHKIIKTSMHRLVK